MGKHRPKDPFGILEIIEDAAFEDDGQGIRPGGGFGVIPQDRLCAVEGCPHEGTPHTCPTMERVTDME